MKKYLILILPFLLVFSNVWAEVVIQNDQQYVGDDGALHIVGEIQNNFDVPVNQINIDATLYSNGEILSKASTNSLVNMIMPGMKGPFDVVVLDRNANEVDSYSIDVSYKITEPKNQVIDITSSDISRDNLNNLVITGMVANKGEITANTISVVTTLYDREGDVAAVSRTQTEPDYLRVNDEAFFLITVPDKSQANTVVDYSIVAESEEYTAVPEFPLGSMILLASSVSAYIGISRYSNKIITNLVSASNLK